MNGMSAIHGVTSRVTEPCEETPPLLLFALAAAFKFISGLAISFMELLSRRSLQTFSTQFWLTVARENLLPRIPTKADKSEI
jgi:hypothetical protein